MIIIRNNRLCGPREHFDFERYIRKQALGKVIVLPSYCEVLAVGKGDPDIVLVGEDGKRIQMLQHGIWIPKKNYPGKYAECSLCGTRCQGYTPNYKYCPNCGAKMDLE